MRAVILAGGKGTRLASSSTLPKPLMPLGEMPILELVIRQLRVAEVDRVTLAVGYMADLLKRHFGGGERVGLPIDYSQEPEPLGTAGPLGLIPDLRETFLAMNGDLLTDLDFRAFIAHHRRARAAATIGVYERQLPSDFGVIQLDGADRVTGYLEKPVQSYVISMGVYVLEPSVLRYLPAGRRFDLPDLMTALLQAGEPVAAYRHRGYWLDIGRPDDYQRAQDDFPSMKARLLNLQKVAA